MRLKHFISAFLALLTLSVGQVWGAYSATFTRVSSLNDLSNNDSIMIVIQDGATTTSGKAIRNNSTNYSNVTISTGTTPTITCTANDLVWKFVVNTNNNTTTYSFQKGSSNSVKYIAWTSSSTLSGTGTTSNTTTWTISPISNYSGYFEIQSTGTDNRYISWYEATTNSKFAAYKTSNFKNQMALNPAVALAQYHGALSIYKKVATSTPTLTCATTSLSFEAEANSTDQKQFTFSGANLTANAGLEITGDNASLFSVQPTSVNKGTGTITNQQVTVTYSPTAAGNHSATLTISSTGATSKTITLTGTATAPAVKHKAFFYNGETLLNTGGTQFAEGAAVSYSGSTPVSCETGTGKSGTFVGWADATWTGKKAAKSDITEANFYEGALPNMGTGDEDYSETYYAVFANVIPGTTTWSLTAIGDLSSTDVFVIADADNYALNNDGGTSNAPTVNSITVANNQITGTVDDNLKWNISGNATDGYTFYPNESTTTWLYCSTTADTKNNDNIRVGTNTTRKVFKIDNNGYLVTKDDYVVRYVSRYDNSGTPQDFRGYVNTNTNPVEPKFYKASTTSGSASNYITSCAAPGQCSAPTFSPDAGTYNVAQNVTLSTITDGATIRYTTDGTAPSKTVGTVYSSAIAVSANTTIKAIAYKDEMTDSEISEGVFNIRYTQPTIATTATPVEEKYTSAIEVTMTATGAEHIYYTTNGSNPEPGEEGTLEYSSAISLSTTGSHTIKAIAVKTGYANSNVASATFVLDLPFTTIKAFIDAAPSTAKSLVLTDAFISGIDGKTMYIQDATAGIMIYGLSELPENAAPNHSISGTIIGKYSLYKKQHELVKPNNTTPIVLSNVTISSEEVSRPTVNSYTSLADAYAVDSMKLVTLTDVYYQASSSYIFTPTSGGIGDGYKIYNTFGALTGKTMPESTDKCNITGVVLNFNGTLELLPVFASDIVVDADAAAPVFTPDGGATSGEAVEVDLNSDIAITAADAKHTVDISTAKIDSESAMNVTAVSSRDFYRNKSVTKWYYGNAAAAAYDILGTGTDANGNEVAATVGGSAATTATVGATVTVTINEAAHFHFAGIQVNSGAVSVTTVTAGEEYTFTMPESNATIAVTYTEDPKYALTFVAGGGSGSAPAISGTTYYAGTEVTLPANTFTYDATHKFKKWLIGSTEYAAGAVFTMPAAATEAVAQWKTIPAFSTGDWVLVKDADELSEGSYVMIAASDAEVAMGSYVSGNNCPGKAAEKNGDLLTYSDQFAIFEIGDYEIEQVTYKTFFDVDSAKYLYLSANSNYLKAGTTKNENAAWTITSVDDSNGKAVVNSKSYSDRSMRYNGNNTSIFACYGSSNTNQKHIVFYKYTEHKFAVTYNKNTEETVTNMPELQQVNDQNKVTISTTTPLRSGQIFNGWNNDENGLGTAYVAGTEYTLTGDLTLYAQWRAPGTCTVSYDANGGSGTMDADENETEGSTYTIKDNEFTRNGFLFNGWKAYDALDEEITITNGKITIPASNVTIKAQWASATNSKWVLVENLSQLADGDIVIIAAKDYNYALGAEAGGNTKYRSAMSVSKYGKLLLTTGSATQLTLGRSNDEFTFKSGDDYLNWTSGNSMTTVTSVDDHSTWLISFDEEHKMHIINKADAESESPREMQYNANSGQERFATYTGSQQAVVIYKYLDMDPEDATSGHERVDLELSGIGTICLPYDVKACDRFGGVFYMPSHKVSGFANFIEETGTLRAGKAYIFVAENEFIRLKYSGDAASEPLSDPDETRGLIGTFEGFGGSYGGSLEGKYVVANNKLVQCNSHAWVNPYRAYLDLDVMPTTELIIQEPVNAAPRRRLGINGGSNLPTGVESVQPSEISIQKVMINGQLYIIRGEKMYNVNGLLVK